MSDRGNVSIGTLIFALALVFVTGCISHKPLSAVTELQRVNMTIVDVTNERTRQTGYPSGTAANVSRVLEVINFRRSGYDWGQKVRVENGIFECALVEASFQTALGKVHCATNGPFTSTLQLEVKSYGIDELQPGWYGPFLCAAAELKDSAGKQIWSGEAASVGSHLVQKAELENNPKLYREDFAEVADDVAHQLIEGPIRQVYINR